MEIAKREVLHDTIRICFMKIKGECKGIADVNTLKHEFEAIRASGITCVVIDASAMTHAIPAIHGQFAYFATIFKDEGGGIRIAHPHEKFLGELRITHLDKFLGVCETKEEAIKSFFKKSTT